MRLRHPQSSLVIIFSSPIAASTPLPSNVHLRMSRPSSGTRWKNCSNESEDAPKSWANKRTTVRILSLRYLGDLWKLGDSRSASNFPFAPWDLKELSVLVVRSAWHV